MGVAVPNEAITDGPDVTWNHIDGPLMHWAGNMHWLTWRERLRIASGYSTVDDVACERFPHLAKARARLLKSAA